MRGKKGRQRETRNLLLEVGYNIENAKQYKSERWESMETTETTENGIGCCKCSQEGKITENKRVKASNGKIDNEEKENGH